MERKVTDYLSWARMERTVRGASGRELLQRNPQPGRLMTTKAIVTVGDKTRDDAANGHRTRQYRTQRQNIDAQMRALVNINLFGLGIGLCGDLKHVDTPTSRRPSSSST